MASVSKKVIIVMAALLLLPHTFGGKLSLTGTVGKCGEPTRLICTGEDIQAEDRYIWYKDDHRVTITDSAHNNQTLGGKYRGSAGNGTITLDINQTNNSDVGNYTCSHNHEESDVFEVTQTCKLSLTGTVGKCGEPTRLICTGDDIQAGDEYIWYKDDPHVTITSNEHNNQTLGGKYRGSAGNGTITLDINQTNNSDVGNYTCSHNHEESDVFEVTQTCSNAGPPSKPAYSFRGLNLELILEFLGVVVVKCLL